MFLLRKALLVSLISCSLFALPDPPYIMRSPKGLLMGDAYTSYATDEYTLFYNPALMARHSGFSFNPINLSFSN